MAKNKLLSIISEEQLRLLEEAYGKKKIESLSEGKERKSERMNIALYPSLKKRLHLMVEQRNLKSVNDFVIELLDRGLKEWYEG